jgi:hypothetical protein
VLQALRDALDDAALASGVAAFEHDHHLVPGGVHPVLQLDQVALQTEQVLEVVIARLAVAVGLLGQRVDRAVPELEFDFLVEAIDQVARCGVSTPRA